MNYKMILCLSTAKVKQRMIIKKLFYLRFTVFKGHVMSQDYITLKGPITKVTLDFERWLNKIALSCFFERWFGGFN